MFSRGPCGLSKAVGLLGVGSGDPQGCLKVGGGFSKDPHRSGTRLGSNLCAPRVMGVLDIKGEFQTRRFSHPKLVCSLAKRERCFFVCFLVFLRESCPFARPEHSSKQELNSHLKSRLATDPRVSHPEVLRDENKCKFKGLQLVHANLRNSPLKHLRTTVV